MADDEVDNHDDDDGNDDVDEKDNNGFRWVSPLPLPQASSPQSPGGSLRSVSNTIMMIERNPLT